MGQQTAGILTPHDRILKYVELANQSGRRFAFRNQRYEPECMAEARYILTYIILVEHRLLDQAEDESTYLKLIISRRLRDYFRNKANTEQVGVHPKQGRMVGEFKADPNDEVSLIDEMESLFPQQRNLIALWREGFTLQDMMFLNRDGVKYVRDMLKVKRMLERSRKAQAKKRAIAAAA
jgi:hypothetical protein